MAKTPEPQNMPEPKLNFCTMRDGGDEIHLECRFEDGQKFAAVTVDNQFQKLAADIAEYLNTRTATIQPYTARERVLAEALTAVDNADCRDGTLHAAFCDHAPAIALAAEIVGAK